MPGESGTIEKPESSPQIEEDLSDKVVSPEALKNTEEIWSAGQEMPEEEEEDLTEEEYNSIQPGKASPMDPDFILIFIFAFFIDFGVDYLLDIVGVIVPPLLEIADLIVDVVATIIIGGWIYWKSKQVVVPDNLKQKIKQMEAKVAKKIEAKITKKIASKAFKKVLSRLIPAFLIESNPVTGVFTSWIAAVISMVM